MSICKIDVSIDVVRLSQVDMVQMDVDSIDVVASCMDANAQEYLMECIIQVWINILCKCVLRFTNVPGLPPLLYGQLLGGLCRISAFGLYEEHCHR